MAGMNVVVLMGNLTKDPEVRHTTNGSTVCDLRLAVDEAYKTSSGELAESTVFVDVAAWDAQAESCETYLKKGAPVAVEGRLKLDQWTTEEGQKRSRLFVRANRVQFLGGRRQEEEPSMAGEVAT